MQTIKQFVSPLLVATLVGAPALAQQVTAPTPEADASAQPVGSGAAEPGAVESTAQGSSETSAPEMQPASSETEAPPDAPMDDSAPTEEASAGFAMSTDDGAAMVAEGPESDSEGYMQKYRPEPNLFEIGMFAGAFFPSKSHNLQDEHFVHLPYDKAALDLGARRNCGGRFRLRLERGASPSRSIRHSRLETDAA